MYTLYCILIYRENNGVISYDSDLGPDNTFG